MTNQTIHDSCEKVKHAIELYAKALSETVGKKTCTELGLSQGLAHDKINRTLNLYDQTIPYIKNFLYEEILQRLSDGYGVFVLDDGALMKRYAKNIEGLSLIRDGSTGTVANGLGIVVLGWTDGVIFIPLDYEFWLAKELVGSAYLSKQAIATNLINRYHNIIKKPGITMDALYATCDFIAFLVNSKIKFEMKMHSNRVVSSKNGTTAPLKIHPQLKLTRNNRSKTAKITWHDMKLFATVQKFKNNNGSIAYRYTVSNVKMTARQHINIYKMRWLIETFFRTSKQLLGLSDCQSTALMKQSAHLFNVFYAYAKLQFKRTPLGFSSVDAFIKHIRIVKYNHDVSLDEPSDQIFCAHA